MSKISIYIYVFLFLKSISRISFLILSLSTEIYKDRKHRFRLADELILILLLLMSNAFSSLHITNTLVIIMKYIIIWNWHLTDDNILFNLMRLFLDG